LPTALSFKLIGIVTFKEITFPRSRHAFVPGDIDIIVPKPGDVPVVPPEQLHSLAYIPWSERYLPLIPKPFREFYQLILPKLAARTTDVHTALSVSFVPELNALSDNKVDLKILTIAVLLHDIGWARLSPLQIANSLNYAAFAYSEDALEPKKLHASLGAETAQEVLDTDEQMLDFSAEDKAFIVKLVRYHDQVNPWPEKPEPLEYLLLGDADRLWSYTHENFWLDTIRKGTPAREYLSSLSELIDGYFLTPYGKQIAHRLIRERAVEVDQLPN
jgi:hypothetical protein